MPKYQCARGVDGSTELIAIMGPGPDGGYEPAADVFLGDEPLTCVVWPGGDRAVVATLPASFSGPNDLAAFDAANPLVAVEFPAAVLATLDVGSYSCRVTLADLTSHLADFELEVLSGPGEAVARPVYHTNRELEDECPWIDRLRDHLKDETGFNEIAAQAREWIDGCILGAVPECGPGLRSYEWGWTWGDGSSDSGRYASALGENALDLTTPGGRRIVRASVYRTLATILRRAVGMSNAPSDLIADSARYQVMADNELISCTADFAGRSLRPISLGRTNTRRW